MHVRHIRLFLLVLCFILVCSVESRSRKTKAEDVSDVSASSVETATGSHFLIELIGHEIYSVVKAPKYKFLIYMTIGTLPNEENTIAILSTVCNFLYGVAVWFGFMWMPRERMLLITLLTLYVGPAIMLVVLGLIGGAMAAFALYPTLSVLAMFLWFFLTSQLAQVLGRRLGLDSDDDGDVDMLDLIHFIASTKIGKAMGFGLLYEALDSVSRDPFQEINRRLDSLAAQIQSNQDAIVQASSSGGESLSKKQ